MLLDIPNWVLALLGLLLVLYIYGTWNDNYFVQFKIPFMKPLPFVGNLAPVMFRYRAVPDVLMEAYNAFPDAKLMGFFGMNKPAFMLRDPELIKLITVKDFEYFTDHSNPLAEVDDPLFAKSLMALKGDMWKEMRNTLTPAFTSSKMKGMFVLVEKCGEQLADHLEKRCKAAKDGLLELEMKDLYTRYTNDVIATSAFGIQCDSLEQPDNEFYRMGNAATDLKGIRIVIFLLFTAFPKIMKALGLRALPDAVTHFFRTLVHGTIATREEKGIIRPDLLHLLMQARKGTLHSEVTDETTPETHKKNMKRELTDDDITAQAFVFFFAGFDTSSTLLAFMSYVMATHPDIQKRLHDDIDALLEEENGKITYDGVQRLKYLDMVISETLRMWPPAIASDRKCSRPYVLPATSTSPCINIRVGDPIFIPTCAIHRDPKYYPEPDRFDPERFSDENKHKINPFTYMPFSVGPRNCIGMRFAQMETKIAMVHLLSRFTLQVVEKTTIPLLYDPKAFTLRVKGGIWLGIKLRSY